MFRKRHARCPVDGARLVSGRGDPLVGTWFAKRFLIEGVIADGDTGRIYRARRLEGGHRYAIKVLWGDVATDPRVRARVVRDGERASRLDHPSLLPVLEVAQTERGLPYLVSDLVDGDSLAQLVRAEGPLDPRRAAALLLQVAAGLAFAHEHGVTHRRLDAGDVLVARVRGRERARLGGFGVAAAGHRSGRGSARDDLHRLGSLVHAVVAAPVEPDGSAAAAARAAAAAALHQLASHLIEDRVTSAAELVCALERHGSRPTRRRRRRWRRRASTGAEAPPALGDHSS